MRDGGAAALSWGWPDTVFLCWLWPIVRKGYFTPLDEDDVPPLPVPLQVASTRVSGAEWWAAQLAAGKLPSIAAMAWEVHRWEAVLGLVISLGYGLLNVVVRPLLLKLTVEAVTRALEAQEAANVLQNVLLVAAIGGSMLLEGVCAASSRHYLSDRIGTAVFGHCATLVQAKSMRLQGVTSSGIESSTLIGSDLVRAYESTKLLAFFPMCIGGGVGGCVLLAITVGWGGVIGIAVMVTITYLNMSLSKKIKKVERLEMAAADHRLGIIRQVINDIKPIKLSTWEGSFVKLIADARSAEVKQMLRFRVLYQGSAQMGRASPFLAACPAFVFMSLTGQDMPAADIFAALSVFMGLRLALIMLPLSISLAAATSVSLGRVEDFLLLPEHEEHPAPPPVDDVLVSIERDGKDQEGNGATFQWPGTAFKLEGVSLCLRRGELLAVTGAVGSGKTSLLCAILAEMPSIDGSSVGDGDDEKQRPQKLQHFVTPSVSYVSQRPFLLSASVQQNITLGTTVDERRLQDACQQAALLDDISDLPTGLETLVGGQQQRVALARAFYQQPDLLVCDDPLSAVDAAVGAHLFRSLQAYAKSGRRAVLIAMNQAHLVRQCKRVIHLVDGKQQPLAAAPSTDASPASSVSSTAVVDPSAVELLPSSSSSADQVDSGNNAVASAATVPEAQDPQPQKSQPPQQQQQKPQEELQKKGRMSGMVVQTWVSSVGYSWCVLCVAVTLAGYGMMGFNDRWLASWVRDDTDADAGHEQMTYIAIYIAGTVLFLLLLILSSSLIQSGGARASRSLHADCIGSLLHAPLSYFDATPSGRLISRFSADMSNVDQQLAQFVDNWLQFTCTIVILMALVVWLIPIMAVAALIVSLGIYFQVSATDRSNREIKRMTNHFMAPVLTCAAESVDARMMLRHSFSSAQYDYGESHERDTAYAVGSSPPSGSSALLDTEKQPMVTQGGTLPETALSETEVVPEFFAARFDSYIEKFLNANFVSSSLVNWSLISSYVVSVIFSMACASYIVVQGSDGSLSPSMAALALTYSFILPYFLMFFGFICSNVKVALTSLERVLELLDVPQEPPWHVESDEMQPNWPQSGAIELRNVSLRYAPGLPLALCSVSLTIASGEKIGICGRTGAGKSSLVALLFRLLDACEGAVFVDGVDVTTVGLQTLRRCMGVIPQSPLLMQGSVRYNLDPFSEYPEPRLQEILSLLGLPETVTLETIIGGGSRSAAGLSAGQRQLLCVGRTLMRKVRIVVLDEPTSNIDATTDARIQESLLRNGLEGATVLTIAHRLHTICDADRIAVMERGQLAECDQPIKLLDDTSSLFHAMASELGEDEMAALRVAAQ